MTRNTKITKKKPNNSNVVPNPPKRGKRDASNLINFTLPERELEDKEGRTANNKTANPVEEKKKQPTTKVQNVEDLNSEKVFPSLNTKGR